MFFRLRLEVQPRLRHRLHQERLQLRLLRARLLLLQRAQLRLVLLQQNLVLGKDVTRVSVLEWCFKFWGQVWLSACFDS
jgi:hypothetical protein